LGAASPTVHGSQNIDRTGPFNLGNQNNFAQANPQYLHQDLLASPEYKQLFIDRVQKFMFNGGALTPAANIARFMERKNEVDPAIIAEAARWGDSKTATPLNKTTWQNEVNWLVNSYFPGRGNTVLSQLRGDGLYTNFAAPTFSQFGGEVPNNYPLTITGPAGTIYFTTDGVTDPRLIGGGVNSSAAVKQYTGVGVPISGTTTVRARLRTAGGQWSGLVEATFNTVTLPGDYNGSGTVNDDDYTVWRSSFGASVAALSGADGNGNGVVDAADYSVWRDNFGASLGSGAAALSAVAAESTVAEATLAESALAAPVDASTSSVLFVASNRPATFGVDRSATIARHSLRSRLAFDNLLVSRAHAGTGRAQLESLDQAFDGFDSGPAADDDTLIAFAGDLCELPALTR
jgi:hypothetical protein